MKNQFSKILVACIICFAGLTVSAQVINNKQLNVLVEALKNAKVDGNTIETIVRQVINNPDLYNSIWKSFLAQVTGGRKDKFKFLNDLNIKFKTFQSQDSSRASLGFSFDFNFDLSKFSEHNNTRTAQSFRLVTKGNVAFNRKVNPTDFLEAKVEYALSAFKGGIQTKGTVEDFKMLNTLDDSIVRLDDPNSAEAARLWAEFSRHLVYTNQYYYGVAPKFSFESNQNFSRTQFAPGINIDLGAKAWNADNLLSRLNIFDYPFALLRLITGTDRHFKVYGSTIPTLQIGLDYVIPQDDSIRNQLTGDKKAFQRFRLETSFRTYISRIKQENIFFNADFRYYQEINAPLLIRQNNIARQTYFVMALQSTSGLFVSFATGKLPFDAKKDEVYSLGFNYKF